MSGVVPLVEARDDSVFGSKAVGLGEAAREGLPLPPGVALSGDVVEAVAAGEETAIEQVVRLARDLPTPLAVRSSAVDEDGADASFAGQHLTLLNVPSCDVLVTEATTEAFNILLPLLGAIVTDSGGLLSHSAIVSREYGIPGVVGTREATDRIPDGARVRVDGDAGTVTVLD